MKKIILIILALLIIIFGIYWLKKPLPESIKQPEQLKASLLLTASRSDFSLDEEIPIKIEVDSGNFEINGVDVILNYDPQFLEFQNIDTSESIFDIFPPLPGKKEEGKISFSALKSPKEKFQGKGEVGKVIFKALQKGETKISFDFTQNSTADSNVALFGQGKDILDKVNELKIKII